ncbi:MAG: hypothetical protein VYD85_06870 [Pseudomonadota bacterium]|nr:hypothetical protein [Pseudomonadota bacterium]
MSFATATNTVSAPQSSTAPSREVAYFAVTANADPGAMPRILEFFAKRGLVLDYCWMDRFGDKLSVELEIAGLDPEQAAYIGRCIGQIYLVDAVDVGAA